MCFCPCRGGFSSVACLLGSMVGQHRLTGLSWRGKAGAISFDKNPVEWFSLEKNIQFEWDGLVVLKTCGKMNKRSVVLLPNGLHIDKY